MWPKCCNSSIFSWFFSWAAFVTNGLTSLCETTGNSLESVFLCKYSCKKILEKLKIISLNFFSVKSFALVKLLTWKLQKTWQRFPVFSLPKVIHYQVFRNSIANKLGDNRNLWLLDLHLLSKKVLKVFNFFLRLVNNKKLTV